MSSLQKIEKLKERNRTREIIKANLNLTENKIIKQDVNVAADDKIWHSTIS